MVWSYWATRPSIDALSPKEFTVFAESMYSLRGALLCMTKGPSSIR